MNKDIIQMISGPRNLSTALMYSFGNRSDVSPIDEPFYCHYLKKFNVDHPGRDEIIAEMETDPNKIIENIFSPKKDGSIRFIKNMAHHIKDLDWTKLFECPSFLLIRDTRKILASFSKVISKPTLEDIGVLEEWKVFQFLIDKGKKPCVLDSSLLLQNPESVLSQLCEDLQIPFSDQMLKWEAGPRKEDGIWAKYWYGNTHKSTSFSIQKTSNDHIPTELKNVNEEAYFYYQKLLAHAIQP